MQGFYAGFQGDDSDAVTVETVATMHCPSPLDRKAAGCGGGCWRRKPEELDLSQDGKAHGGGPQTLVWGVQHDLPPPRDESGHECGLLSVLVELGGSQVARGTTPARLLGPALWGLQEKHWGMRAVRAVCPLPSPCAGTSRPFSLLSRNARCRYAFTSRLVRAAEG